MDGLNWSASYELTDFGNTISVTCMFENMSSNQAKTVLLDWVLVIDGQKYLPKGFNTLVGLPPASAGAEHSVPAGGVELLWVLFDMPPGRSPDQDAKAFMQTKDVMIAWPSANIQLKIKQQ